MPTRFAPHGLRLPEGTVVEGGVAWESGLVEVQDEGSQLIVAAAGVRPGMLVLDLCAGAGGKTLALADHMADEGRLIAADVNRARLSKLPPRARRAGVEIIETRLLDPGMEAAALVDLRGRCDIVLVDAPCSGTGTWRRNPEARWRLTPDRLAQVMTVQMELLGIAAELVCEGGVLIYAVCSLLDEEGACQVERFLAHDQRYAAAECAIEAGRARGGGRLLTPAHDATDGFFFARLIRS